MSDKTKFVANNVNKSRTDKESGDVQVFTRIFSAPK